VLLKEYQAASLGVAANEALAMQRLLGSRSQSTWKVGGRPLRKTRTLSRCMRLGAAATLLQPCLRGCPGCCTLQLLPHNKVGCRINSHALARPCEKAGTMAGGRNNPADEAPPRRDRTRHPLSLQWPTPRPSRRW
jgi:hypothetical protein